MLRVTFVGDVFLSQEKDVALAPEIQSIFDDADLVIGNFEGPATDCDAAPKDRGRLKQTGQTARRLRQQGFDVFTLANNHMFDQGWEGFEDTRRALADAGLSFLGAGENIAVASRPLVVERASAKIGLLAYGWEGARTVIATDTQPGCAPLEEALMLRQVRDLAAEVDIVIVLPHWGYCDHDYPMPGQLDLARRLLEAGATAVVGHHSHVVQGLDFSQGRLVAYSLGNFYFGAYEIRGRCAKLTKENYKGALLTLRLTRGEVRSYDMVFTRQEAGRIAIDSRPSRRKEFQRRCETVQAPDYQKRWRRYVRWRTIRRFCYLANPLHWREIHREHLGAARLMARLFFSRR